MHRRKFLTLVSGSLILYPWTLRAEHDVISADPWIIAFDLASLKGRNTPTQDFYVRNHFAVPPMSVSQSLQVEGEVEKPQQITPATLTNVKQQTIGALLECAGDGVESVALASNGVWQGWPLADVLSLAQPMSKGTYLHLFGRDGYSRSVPIERAFNGGLLVTSLNQAPLTANHGAPWRALFPGWYGMDSVKWLSRMVVSDHSLPDNEKSYIELSKTSSGEAVVRPLPRILVKSVITFPAERSVLPRGTIKLRGLAWSGEGKISSVEVADSMSNQWRPATLDLGGPYEWALWESTLDLTQTGAVTFVCRATDEKGATQPSDRDPGRLDRYGNNWYHRVQCVVA